MRDYPFQKSRFVNQSFLYRRSAQQEEGLWTAFIGGIIVNLLYCLAYPSSPHLLHKYTKSTKRTLTAKVFIFCVVKRKILFA